MFLKGNARSAICTYDPYTHESVLVFVIGARLFINPMGASEFDRGKAVLGQRILNILLHEGNLPVTRRA
jgi:hypothetical protein